MSNRKPKVNIPGTLGTSRDKITAKRNEQNTCCGKQFIDKQFIVQREKNPYVITLQCLFKQIMPFPEKITIIIAWSVWQNFHQKKQNKRY